MAPDTTCHPDMVRFWETLAEGVDAGRPLVAILRSIQLAMPPEPMGSVAAALAGDLDRGKTLSQAMENQPRIFSRAHVCLIEGGERVGRVERLLHLILELTRDCPACGNLQFPKGNQRLT